MNKKWQPITTAPKDGSVIKLRTIYMENNETFVYGKWGDYWPEWLSRSKRPFQAWILVDDPRHKTFNTGTLLVPEEWAERDTVDE